MGRIGKRIKELNTIAAIYFIFIVLVTIFLFSFALGFKDNYTNYQKEQVIDLKSEVSNVLASDSYTKGFTDLDNEYSFEIIIQENNTILYTSNTIYDIDEADNVYNNNYIYRETYVEDGKLIWLVVTNVDTVEFTNYYLIVSSCLLMSIIIATIILLRIMYIRASKPLLRVLDIIKNLRKNKYSKVVYEEQLDLVSDQLLLLYNEVNLMTYQFEQNQEEYKRINKVQKSLLEEQKQYLETVVHDIKSPLASIDYSRFVLESVLEENSNEKVTRAINDIRYQGEGALNLILETLDTVKNNSQELFTSKESINVEDLISKYFEENKIILDRNSLVFNIKSNTKDIKTNRIKFIQMMNNILSNMINYAKKDTELKIILDKDKFSFINIIGKNNNEYSTNYGSERIIDLANDLDMKIDIKSSTSKYVLELEFGDKYD